MGAVAAEGELLEREGALAEIGRLLDGLAGGDGRVLAIEGPAGIGKTALTRTARELARHRGLRVLGARASELERDYAFGAARQWLETVLREAGPEERGRLFAGAAAPAAAVLEEHRLDDTGGDTTDRVIRGLYWLIANVAEAVPLLLVLDDAHWVDESSTRLLNFLAPRLEGLPVSLLLATRPPELDDTGLLLARVLSDPACTVHRPGPLAIAGAAELLARRLGVAPEPAFAAACHDVTGGNPFYLRGVADALALERIAPTESEIPRLRSLAPQDLSRAIVSRLSAPARALAQALAILDDPAAYSIATALAGLDAEAADDAVTELGRAGLVGAGLPPQLVHPIIRAAVLASLSPSERASRHSAAAHLLTEREAGAERVAIHLLETPPGGDAAVAEQLRTAADLAAGRGAPEVAVRLLRRALAEPPDATVRPAILGQLGQCEHDLDLADAAEHLWEAAQTAQDPDLRARALLRLGSAGGMRLEMPPGFEELFDRELARARERDYELWLGMMASRITADWLNTTGRARALERLESLRDLSGKTPGEAIVLSIAARIELDRGAPALVVADLARRAAASRPARGEQGPSSPLVLHTAIALRQCELLDESDAVLEDALAVSRERGTATGFAIASANRSGNARRRGDLRRAEADARAALASGGTRGWYRLGATTYLIEALIELGRLDEASEALAEAGLRDGPVPAIRPATPILIARACLRHARGELEAAEVDYVDALARIARHTPGNTVGLDARLGLAEVHHLTGRQASAVAMAEEAVAITDHWGTPGLRGIARRALARATGGEAGIELLRAAIALLEQSPFVLELAAAQIDLGASLRRAGSRADARDPLRAGLRAAEVAAATPLIEHARQELAATGMRVRRGPSHDVLTPSEQRIAEMAAAGASNPEIAQALFVTIKTVETHLGNAYRKLDINSRRDLPRALGERTAD